MRYLIPIFYTIIPYTFLYFVRYPDHTTDLQTAAIILPLIAAMVNLVTVLTAGRKWSRKTLLNCTLIIKYGLIPFYLIGACFAASVSVLAIFPLPIKVIWGLITGFFLALGYGILLGSAPFAIAYLVKARKEGTHSKAATILSGVCQFFLIFDVLSMMILTIKERHLVKTTVFVLVATSLILLLIGFFVGILFFAA